MSILARLAALLLDSTPLPRPPYGRLISAVARIATMSSLVRRLAGCFASSPGPGRFRTWLVARPCCWGVVVVGAPVRCGDGGFVYLDGGFGQAALLVQVDQVFGDQRRG